MSTHGSLTGSSTSMRSRRRKVRVLAGLVSALLTPLLLTACHGGDSIAPNTTTTLVWSKVLSGEYAGVWGTSASDVWAVGYNGTILHYNGTNWSSVSSGATEPLYGVWGSSASDVWVVGLTGILHGSPTG